MKPKHYLVLGCMGTLDFVVIAVMAALLIRGNLLGAAGSPQASAGGATKTVLPSASPAASPTSAAAAESAATLTPAPATPTPAKTLSPTPGAELAAQAWQIFQTYLGFLQAYDIDSANALLWPSARTDMPACVKAYSEDRCWALLDGLYSSAAQYTEADFTNVWADEKQLILSTDPVFDDETGEVEASRAYLFFVFNPPGRILFLHMAVKSWQGGTEAETREMLLDTDQDGLTDDDETCLHQPADICTPTDPLMRDTDGDGDWDSIEEAAETDPNDPASHL